jgi:hypothetical protein
MATSHLTRKGNWRDCPTPEACDKLFHVQLPVAEAAQLPMAFIERLAEAIDPPARVYVDGTKEWGTGNWLRHREYGLPAVIQPDGTRLWMENGAYHRRHDLPAYVSASIQGWYRRGKLHRGGDRPAITEVGEEPSYFRKNKQYTPKVDA